MSTNSSLLISLATVVLYNLVFIGLSGAGVVAGMRFWYRRGAGWCLAGCGLLLLFHLASTAMTVGGILQLQGINTGGIGIIEPESLAAAALQGVAMLLYSTGFACLVVAFARSVRPVPPRGGRRGSRPMTLSTLDASLSWYEWMLYATWILGSVLFCGLMLAGGWIAWRRPHAGTRCFLAGCVLLAVASIQGILAWLVSASSMTASGRLGESHR